MQESYRFERHSEYTDADQNVHMLVMKVCYIANLMLILVIDDAMNVDECDHEKLDDRAKRIKKSLSHLLQKLSSAIVLLAMTNK